MLKEEFLINGISVLQDDELYTFTSDSVLLSKFAKVKPKDVVADFCAGCGIVGFNLYALNLSKISSVTFFELQKPLFDLCVKNISLNTLAEKFGAVNCDLKDLPKTYYGKFSLIVCNPPYMKGGDFINPEIALCKSENALPLKDLCFAVGKALKFGGRVSMVHSAERLAEVVFELKNNGVEPKRLQFVSAGEKPPYAFLLEGVKGGKAGLKVFPAVKN